MPPRLIRITASIKRPAMPLQHASTDSMQAIKHVVKVMGSATIRAKAMVAVAAAMCAGTVQLS
jgi:hypothetical protein